MSYLSSSVGDMPKMRGVVFVTNTSQGKPFLVKWRDGQWVGLGSDEPYVLDDDTPCEQVSGPNQVPGSRELNRVSDLEPAVGCMIRLNVTGEDVYWNGQEWVSFLDMVAVNVYVDATYEMRGKFTTPEMRLAEIQDAPTKADSEGGFVEVLMLGSGAQPASDVLVPHGAICEVTWNNMLLIVERTPGGYLLRGNRSSEDYTIKLDEVTSCRAVPLKELIGRVPASAETPTETPSEMDSIHWPLHDGFAMATMRPTANTSLQPTGKITHDRLTAVSATAEFFATQGF